MCTLKLFLTLKALENGTIATVEFEARPSSHLPLLRCDEPGIEEPILIQFIF
ncbi:hypothetical protein RP20_CCG006464 [Aedes albopictus]|nr:hypothetical protein RP20_CCG006464 [Aedes albopictus]